MLYSASRTALAALVTLREATGGDTPNFKVSGKASTIHLPGSDMATQILAMLESNSEAIVSTFETLRAADPRLRQAGEIP